MDKTGDGKFKRAKRFKQMETELLLELIMSSNLETNKVTVKGRSMEWESITRAFNASRGVVQRTEKELKERAANIRKDLYKLARFQKECVQESGGGPLLTLKPPKISFELTEVVKKFARSLQVKLADISPVDSDMTPSPETSKNYIDPSLYLFDVVGDAASSSVEEWELPNANAKRDPISTAVAVDVTTQTRSLKRNLDGNPTSSSSSRYTQDASAAYYEAKMKFLVDENMRHEEENERRREMHVHRKEWNKRCMDVKKEELAMRAKQTEFWSILVKNLKTNPENCLNMASVARAMEPSNSIIKFSPVQFEDDEGDEEMSFS